MSRLIDKEIQQDYDRYLSLAKQCSKGQAFSPYDLLHDTILMLYNMDQNKINDIIHAGKIKPYIDSSIRLASRSKQSHFYRQYRRFSATSVEFKPEHMKPPANTFILVLEGNVDNVINHLPEFEREVFLLWALDGFRYETLSKATGIPIWYLYRAVQRAKKLIKQNIPHDLHITRRKGSTS